MPEFLKQAAESLDYDFDFSDVIPSGDSLQSSTSTSTVTVASGLTAGTKTHNTTTSVVKQVLSGGTAGTSYLVTCTITTTLGRIITRDLTIVIGSAAKPTPAEIASHIETDLNQEAIQRLIDSEEAEVILRFGAHAAQTDDLEGGSLLIFPTRKVASVTSVTETSGSTDTVLAANDYLLRHGGRSIERRSDGTNGASRWSERVRVVYAPFDDTARRKRVIVDLVQLAIKFNALSDESDGDYRSTSLKYQETREEILSTLAPAGRMFA